VSARCAVCGIATYKFVDSLGTARSLVRERRFENAWESLGEAMDWLDKMEEFCEIDPEQEIESLTEVRDRVYGFPPGIGEPEIRRVYGRLAEIEGATLLKLRKVAGLLLV